MSETSIHGKDIRALKSIPAAASGPVRFRGLSRPEVLYLIALTGFLSQSILNTAANMVGALLPSVTASWFTPLAIFLPLALYLAALVQTRAPVRVGPFLVLYAAFLVFLVITVSQHPEYARTAFDPEWNGSAYTSLLSFTAPIFAFLLVSVAPSGRLIMLSLVATSYLTFIGNIVRFVQAQRRGYWIGVYSDGTEFQTGYDLGFGYSVLVSLVVFAFLAFAGRRPIVHGIGVLFCLSMILTDGSRAPLGIAFLALLLLMVHFRRRIFGGSRIRVAAGFFGASAAIILMANFMNILVGVRSWMAARGSSSRTLDTLIDGSFTQDNARGRLGDISAQLITSGGPFGHGIYGDRHSIRPLFHWGYPHNIVDEFLITYGWFGGSLIIVVLVGALLMAYLRSRGTLHADLIVVVLPLIFQLWVSMSYLLSVWFWVLLCLVWRALTLRREELRGESSCTTLSPRQCDEH